jgi:hypothetical protein
VAAAVIIIGLESDAQACQPECGRGPGTVTQGFSESDG